MKKLAIVTSHPIQYNAPIFRLLAERGKLQIKVFYTWGESVLEKKFDPGFGRNIEWDIPLLDGYEYLFVANKAKEPGSHHYNGIDNPSLISEIKNWGATSVLVFGWSFKSHLKVMRYFKGKIPVLFRGDSTLLDETPGIKQILRRQVLKWVYRYIDKAIYTGAHNKDYYLAHGLKDTQLIYAPHAVENNRFAYWDESLRRKLNILRNELGFAEDSFIVLFAGKLIPKKNPWLLFKVAEELSSDVKIQFLFVGNGELEKEMKQKASNNNRIKFLDFQNQSMMPVIYRLGNVFILPSLGPGETWGLALNEAMACGIPVMASDKCGGSIDLIQQNENGLVFAPNDVAAVKKFILRLYESREFSEKAAKASLERIKSFNFANIAEAVELASGSVDL